MHASDTHRIITNYYKQLYMNKPEELEKIDRFLYTYNLLKLIHGAISNLDISL